MDCPEQIANLILRIMQTGIIQARSAGWSQNAELASLEADHIHNLPDLLLSFTMKKLRYYWSAERPSYIHRMGGEPICFEALWAEMKEPVEQALSQLSD